MTEESNVLKIDSGFRRLVFPYDKGEYAALEKQILKNGCQQPVVVWYGYVIHGFEQYEICIKHNIAFEIKYINFRVREEVISLTCREELRTRNLPVNQRRYLIGKRYNADIIIEAHNAAGTDQFRERVRRNLSKDKKFYENSAGRIKDRFAEEYHLNQCSVIRYSTYAQSIDYVASIRPDAANQILAGEMKILMDVVIACYGKTEDKVTELLTTSGENMSDKKPAFAEKEIEKGTTIKDMPAFDPDAEINSLALTIPSWVSSIDRTRSTAKFSLLTQKGRNQLEQELHKLQEAAQAILHALKEVR